MAINCYFINDYWWFSSYSIVGYSNFFSWAIIGYFRLFYLRSLYFI
jgi:hypothetical protein